jgi:O-antigen/teichoic acid export membrane protein
MQKTFITNLILIVFLNLIVKPFYLLGIDAEVQNRVGAELYGNYFALLNFSFLLNILLDFGITNFNNRNIAQHPHLIQKHFGKLLSIRLILFVFYAFVTLSLGGVIGYSLNQLYILSILVFNQFLVATIQYARSNFAGLHLFKIDAFMSVLDRLLLILICGFLLWGPFSTKTFKIEWFIYAQTFAYLLAAVLALIVLKTKIKTISVKLNKTFSLAILKQSFPYALLILLMMFYNRVDSVMLERLLIDGSLQAGIYAQGFRYLDAINMFALLFAGLLLPMFARLIKQKKSITPLLELSESILLPISIVIGITAFFYKQTLIDLRYDAHIREAAQSFGYLILSFIPISITYIYGTLLTANGSLKQLNLMAVCGVVLNVILNALLIPRLKAEGAAVATLITQTVTAFIQVILVYHILNIKSNWLLIFKLSLLTFLLIGLNLSLYQFNFKTEQKLIIAISIGVFLPFILQLIKIKTIIKLLKSEH